MENVFPKNEHGKNPSEQMKNVLEVFRLCPELEKVGTAEQYEKYVETIFPESEIKDIVWHGNKNEFKDSGFKTGLGRENTFSDDGQFYGFYFGDYYSHYGGEGTVSYPCRVNISKLKLLFDREGEPSLSGIDTSKSIRKQFNMTDEDGILELGGMHLNKNASREDYEARDRKMEKKFFDYLQTIGKTRDGIENETQVVTKEDIRGLLDKEGTTAFGISELVVFKPEQIHILGSKSDIEKFAEFVASEQK